MRRNDQSTKNCAASVATARYKPLMRNDGMPNTTPIAVAHRPPSSSETISGMPSTRIWKLYAAYAPTAMNAPVPSDICPQ